LHPLRISRHGSHHLFLGLCLLGVVGCAAGGTSGGNTASSTLPPAAATKLLLDYQRLKFSERQFYVGLGAGSSLDLARETAFAKITPQLTWMPGDSRPLLKGFYRLGKTVRDAAGDFHVLAYLDRESASAHLQKSAQIEQDRGLSDANRCQTLLNANEIGKARRCLGQVRAKLPRIRQLVVAAKAAVGDRPDLILLPVESRVQQLRARITTDTTRRNVGVTWVVQTLDGGRPSFISSPFAQALTRQGWKVRQANATPGQVLSAIDGDATALLSAANGAGAGAVLVGQVTAKYLTSEDGFYYASASGTLRLVDAVSKRTLAEIVYPEKKAGHVGRAQAVQKAASQASAFLQAQVATALLNASSR
jgi:hypothetical protein